MITLKTDQDLPVYSDDSIQSEIWKKICQYGEIRALGMDSFSISVQKGLVLLNGHVSKKYHRNLMEEIARSMPGVQAVHNKLILDSDLIIQVAQALSKDERTSHFIFPVGCTHGWIHLGGVVPRREEQIAAEEIATQVPSVGGVLSRPRVIGETSETDRRPIQPQIHAKTYDYNRSEAVVTQIVLQPRNRLVTHAVVGNNGFREGKFVVYEYLVPVDAMDVVDTEIVITKRNGPSLTPSRSLIHRITHWFRRIGSPHILMRQGMFAGRAKEQRTDKDDDKEPFEKTAMDVAAVPNFGSIEKDDSMNDQNDKRGD